MMMHDLKTHPESFRAIWDGKKRFEYRIDDRGFNVGDVLKLREWDPEPEKYTGRAAFADVEYTAKGPAWGILPGYCVMSLGVVTCYHGDDAGGEVDHAIRNFRVDRTGKKLAPGIEEILYTPL
jgi:hypothetical protein